MGDVLMTIEASSFAGGAGLPADVAAKFLSDTSGLSRHVLAEIYELATDETTGSPNEVNYRSFCAACRLVAHAQSGIQALNHSLLSVLPKSSDLFNLRRAKANNDRVWEVWYYALAPDRSTGVIPPEIREKFFENSGLDCVEVSRICRRIDPSLNLDKLKFARVCATISDKVNAEKNLFRSQSSASSTSGFDGASETITMSEKFKPPEKSGSNSVLTRHPDAGALEARLAQTERRLAEQERSIEEQFRRGIITSKKELLLYVSLVKEYREAAAKLQNEVTKLAIRKEALRQECFMAKEQLDRLRNIYTELLVKSEAEKCEIDHLTAQRNLFLEEISKVRKDINILSDRAHFLANIAYCDKGADAKKIEVDSNSVQLLNSEVAKLQLEYVKCKDEKDLQIGELLKHLQSLERSRHDELLEMGAGKVAQSPERRPAGVRSIASSGGSCCPNTYACNEAAVPEEFYPRRTPPRELKRVSTCQDQFLRLSKDHRGVPNIVANISQAGNGRSSTRGRPDDWETFEAVQHSSF